MQALSELTCRGTPQKHACRSKNVRVNPQMSELTPVTVLTFFPELNGSIARASVGPQGPSFGRCLPRPVRIVCPTKYGSDRAGSKGANDRFADRKKGKKVCMNPAEIPGIAGDSKYTIEECAVDQSAGSPGLADGGSKTLSA